MMRLFATTIAAATSMAMPFSASAACDPFVVYGPGEQREAYYVDLGEEGPNVGDMLIGRRGLQDADGNPLGAIHWHDNVQALDANGVATSIDSHIVLVLDDGVIFSVGDISIPSQVASHSERNGFAPSAVVTWDIVGGTGAYAGTRGTITAEAEGDDNLIRVDLTCD